MKTQNPLSFKSPGALKKSNSSNGPPQGMWGLCLSSLPLLLHVAACCACAFFGLRLAEESMLVFREMELDAIKSGARLNNVITLDVASSSQNVKHSSSSSDHEAFLFPSRHERVIRKELSCMWSQALEFNFSSGRNTGEDKIQRERKRVGAPSGSRVGRHGILVRSYPHPDPRQVVLGTSLLSLLQEHHERLHSVYPARPVLVVTTTRLRTFQAIHMNGLVHSLKLVRAELLWIVVEANERTEETQWILEKSGLPFVHLAVGGGKKEKWGDHSALELQQREEGLRFIRKHRLQGLVVFAEDSTVFHRDFFEEAQKVKWFGAFPLGILLHTSYLDYLLALSGMSAKEVVEARKERERQQSDMEQMHEVPPPRWPLQSPVCDESGRLVGWHTVRRHAEDIVKGLPRYSRVREEEAERESLIWSGFVFNAKILWGRRGEEEEEEEEVERAMTEEAEGERGRGWGGRMPEWVRVYDEWEAEEKGGKQRSAGDLLRRMVKDESRVEVMGGCGESVLVWWLRGEARPDSKHPARWELIPQLEIVVPSRTTPWPDPQSPPPPAPPSPPPYPPPKKPSSKNKKSKKETKDSSKESKHAAKRKEKKEKNRAAESQRMSSSGDDHRKKASEEEPKKDDSLIVKDEDAMLLKEEDPSLVADEDDSTKKGQDTPKLKKTGFKQFRLGQLEERKKWRKVEKEMEDGDEEKFAIDEIEEGEEDAEGSKKEPKSIEEPQEDISTRKLFSTLSRASRKVRT